MLFIRILATLLLMPLVSQVSAQDFVVEDQGVGFTKEELTYLIAHWTPQMRQAAAADRGDMLELVNMSLAAKKIASQAKDFKREDDPAVYWAQQFRIRNIDRQFVVNNYMRDLVVPDMTELAQERYQSERDKYAALPEERLSSHILMMCSGECNRREYRAEVEKVRAELDAGANFENLVLTYSEDPGSKDNGGRFDRWLQKGKFSSVSPQYHQAVFEIENIGDFSPVTESGYGFHIIRLDDIRPKRYRTYEEVEDVIVADLVKEYRTLAAKEFDTRFNLTSHAVIDGAALTEILAPFKIEAPVLPDQSTAPEGSIVSDVLKNLKAAGAIDPNSTQ